MKRILIVLLIVLGTSYFVQKEFVLKNLKGSLTERMQPAPEVIQDQPKAQQADQFDMLAYPSPEDDWPYIPPPDYSHETPLPTPDLSILPTLAPTMNPLDE